MSDNVTDSQRVAYALERLRRWESNLRANADAYMRRGESDKARLARLRALDIADVAAMLDGYDDTYIEHLARRNGE